MRWLFWWLMVLIVLFLGWAVPSHAKENTPGEFDGFPPHVRQWFQNYHNPKHPEFVGGCCDESDCHVNREWEMRDGKYFVFIEELDRMIEVPDEFVVTDQGNPTGTAVVCYKMGYNNGVMSRVIFYCFTPGSSG